ncbi:unnamed protein product [Trichobilharzia szidati]|nr:unnamed protein product [Trichobilharzia szidati]
MEALLAYVDVPPDCRDAIPLLNLENQSFAKILKRMLKKLEKGETSVQKQLPKISNDGNEENSDYLFVGTSQEESSNILFARLPDSTGGNEIYRLPFLRFSVRKANEPEKVETKEDTEKVKDQSNETNIEVEPCLENTIKNLNDKIDNFGSQLTKLLESLPQNPKPSRPRPRKSETPAAAKTTNSTTTTTTTTTTNATAPNTPNAAPAAKSTPTPRTTPANKPKTPVTPAAAAASGGNQSKSTPNKSSSVHFPGTQSNNQTAESKAKPKNKATESSTTVKASDDTNTNADSLSTIDSAINKVLSRINKGKDIHIGSVLQERLSGCVNGKDATAIDYDVDIDSSPPAPPTHIVEEYRCPVGLPRRNLVAISPTVSFTVKPVQSSVPPSSSTKRDYSSIIIEEHDDVSTNSVSAQDDCTIIDVHTSGEKKKKHKNKRRKQDTQE